MRIIFFILTIFLISCSRDVTTFNAQNITRKEIQDYNTIEAFRSEALVPRKNDKVFIRETGRVYYYDWSDGSSSDNGSTLLVQSGGFRWKALTDTGADTNTDTKTYLIQDSILVYTNVNDVEIGRDTIKGVGGGSGGVGPQGPPGEDGDDGVNGLSAYEVAVANGFVGDETAWLASLVGETGGIGPQGDPGPSGQSAYGLAVTNGFMGTEEEWLLSLIGEQGPQGDPGPQGEQGPQGDPGADGADGADGLGLEDFTAIYTPILEGSDTVGWEIIYEVNSSEVDRDTLPVSSGKVPSLQPYIISGDTVGFVLYHGAVPIDTIHFEVGDAGVDFVNNYTELRALVTTHSVVTVRDWTYVGPDGKTYTTLGGVFKKVESGSENGGTVIVGAAIWQRQWDSIHVQPEWWECGGYDSQGNIYTSKNTSTLGQINGIYSDSDRINTAQQVGKIVKLQARVYEIDSPLRVKRLQGAVGHYQESASYGEYGSVIKDKIIPNTTLTVAYTAGGSTITVADASGFRCGQIIAITLNSGTYGGQGYDEAVNINTLVISNISGNVITFYNFGIATVRNAPVGSKVGVIKSHTVYPNFSIENILFDGQWDYDDYITYDWRLSAYLGQINTSGRQDITNISNKVIYCKFKNIPSEVINGSVDIQKCAFYNIGGGILHYGIDNLNKTLNNLHISDIIADSICLVANAVSVHEEAFITFSNNVQNVFINNCRITNLAGRVIGDIAISSATTEEDGNIWIDNCYFEGIYFDYHTATPENVTTRKTTFSLSNPINGNEFILTNSFNISNTTFVNTGDIIIVGATSLAVQKGKAPLNISFKNCRFTNVRLHAQYSANIKFSGCEMYHRPNFKTFTDFTFGTSNNAYVRSAFLNFDRCDNIVVENCNIEGNNLYNQYIDYGICFEPRNMYRKDSAGVDTKLVYYSQLRAINNVVKGVSFGIGQAGRPDDNNGDFYNQKNGILLGCEISGNKVFLERNADVQGSNIIWGILAYPGTEVRGNYIQYPEVLRASLTVFGIVAQGIENGDKDKLPGVRVIGNVIHSLSTSAQNIRQSHPHYGIEYYNNIVMSNITTGDIQTTSGHYLLNNVKVSTVLTNLTSPYNIPDEIYLFKNKGVY